MLVSEEGPPAAEFALFDPSDIELAPADQGALRETGYRTTATDALRRLAVAGVTRDLADECAEIVRGRVAEAYARGPAVRRIATLLGPAELFEGGTYDAGQRRYDGTWLDLPLLASDAGIGGQTGVLQAMSLVALLSEVMGETVLVLSTLGHSESLRLGERTLRRMAITGVSSIPRALRHLAEHAPTSPQHNEGGPSREAISEMIRSRLDECAQAEARDHLARIARALRERSRPAQGPLSDPEVWEAEQLLSRGDVGGALRRIEAREKNHGREPGTIYLRARAALLHGRESPRAVAARVGEMALSMSNFPEVMLLAAQAWNAAGETRIALPFARDLVGNPRVHDELRTAAEAILRAPRVSLEGSVGQGDFDVSDAGELEKIAASPVARSERPRSSERPASSDRSHANRAKPASPSSARPSAAAPPRSAAPPARTPAPAGRSEAPRSVRPEAPRSVRPEARGRPPPASHPPVRIAPAADRAASPVARSVPPPTSPSAPDPRVEPGRARGSDPPGTGSKRTLTPPEVPPPQTEIRRFLTPPERIASPLPPRTVKSAPAPPRSSSILPPSLPHMPVVVAPAPRVVSEPAAPSAPSRKGSRHPSSEPPPTPRRPSGRVVQPEPWPPSLRAPREEAFRPEEIEHTPAARRTMSKEFMRGASLPPTRSEPAPPVTSARASVVPRVDIDEAELVEALALPRGAEEVNLEPHEVPSTPLEARIRFTLESRELGRRYRRESGVELRLEPRALPVLQRRLAEQFPQRVVTTPEEAREAELHGALLSELLARVLDAEWVDISPSELGYWAMVVPVRGGGGVKRVWPFGRILRFIASGGEDDLVAFFRKLRELG